MQTLPQAKYAPNVPASIPCCAYNADGNIFAYAVSYDWSRGYQVCNTGRYSPFQSDPTPHRDLARNADTASAASVPDQTDGATCSCFQHGVGLDLAKGGSTSVTVENSGLVNQHHDVAC